MRKVFAVFGIIVVAAVFFLLVLSKRPEIKNLFDGLNSNSFAGQLGGGCQNREVSFTHTPIALNQIGFIYPLGRVGDAHVTPTDHAYIAPVNQKETRDVYDIVSPADGEVVSVQSMPAQTVGDSGKGTRAPEDYRIILRFSCRYYAIFIHAHALAPKVQKAVGTISPSETKFITVPVKAGEPVAKMSGQWLDWSMNDTQSTLSGFIHPKLYESEPWKIHTVDPFSVYSGDIKNKLIALSARSVAPFGGKIDYDEPGRAIGNWFAQGTGGFAAKPGGRFWDGHLAIIPDAIDPSRTSFSFGNWQGRAEQFMARDNFNPAAVTVSSGPVKVELTEVGEYLQANGQPWNMGQDKPVKPLTMKLPRNLAGTVLLQVLPGEKLRLEKFPGQAQEQVTSFTPAAQTFER